MICHGWAAKKPLTLLLVKINLLLAFVVVAIFFAAVRENQLAPHLVVSKIGTKEMSRQWVTNPAYVSFRWETKPSSNGLDFIAIPETNYHWKVWRIFR